MKNLLTALACVLLVSCSSTTIDRRNVTREEVSKAFPADKANPTIIVSKVKKAIKLDGVLSEDEWKDVWDYEMVAPLSHESFITPKRGETLKNWPFQGGKIQVQYDDTTLYVAVKVVDHDVVDYAEKDQSWLFKTGDTIEVFLKSKKNANYWELYGTPGGHKATLIQHGPDYCHDMLGTERKDFQAVATVQGTLNNYKDTDEGFIIEFAIPFKMLEDATGIPVNNDGEWTLQVSRYNYTFGQVKQYSAFPALPQVSYHLFEHYANLQFED